MGSVAERPPCWRCGTPVERASVDGYCDACRLAWLGIPPEVPWEHVIGLDVSQLIAAGKTAPRWDGYWLELVGVRLKAGTRLEDLPRGDYPLIVLAEDGKPGRPFLPYLIRAFFGDRPVYLEQSWHERAGRRIHLAGLEQRHNGTDRQRATRAIELLYRLWQGKQPGPDLPFPWHEAQAVYWKLARDGERMPGVERVYNALEQPGMALDTFRKRAAKLRASAMWPPPPPNSLPYPP